MMHLADYLGVLHHAEIELGEAFREVGRGHRDEPEVHAICHKLAARCDAHAEKLGRFAERYGEDAPDEPEQLHSEVFRGIRGGGPGLLRDLHDLHLMACECEIAWTLVGQAAHGARDTRLLEVVRACERETSTQLKWLATRMKRVAPQALVVAP
jgi:hypothetical protein